MKKLFQIVLYLLVNQFTFAQVNADFSTKNTDFTIVNKDVYKVVNSTENSIESGKLGTPQLPTFSRNYVLPAGSLVTNLSVSNGSKTEMGGG
jgi:hypothetical protein